MESHSILAPANRDNDRFGRSTAQDNPILSEFKWDINLLPYEMWHHIFSFVPQTEFSNLTLGLPKEFKPLFDGLLHSIIVNRFLKFVRQERNKKLITDDSKVSFPYSSKVCSKETEKETALKIYEDFHNQILDAIRSIEISNFEQSYQSARQKISKLVTHFADEFIGDKAFSHIYQHILINEHVLTLWAFHQFLPAYSLKELGLNLPTNTHLIAAAKGKVFLLDYLLNIGFTLDVVHKDRPLVPEIEGVTLETVESPLSFALITYQKEVVDFILHHDANHYYTQATLHSALAKPDDKLNQIIIKELALLKVRFSNTYLFNVKLPTTLTSYDLLLLTKKMEEAGSFLSANHLIALNFNENLAAKASVKVLTSHLAKSPAWENYFFTYTNYLAGIRYHEKSYYFPLYIFYKAHPDNLLWWRKQIKNFLCAPHKFDFIFTVAFAIKVDPTYFNKDFWLNFLTKQRIYYLSDILTILKNEFIITPGEANKLLFNLIKYQPDLYEVHQETFNRLVSILLHLKADIDAIDEEGYTPLMLTVRLGYLHFARSLVSNGANRKIKHRSSQLTARQMLNDLSLPQRIIDAFSRLLTNDQNLYLANNHIEKASKPAGKSKKKRKAASAATTTQATQTENADQLDITTTNGTSDLINSSNAQEAQYHSIKKRHRLGFFTYDQPTTSQATSFLNPEKNDIPATMTMASPSLAGLNDEEYDSLRRSLLPVEEENLLLTHESENSNILDEDNVLATIEFESENEFDSENELIAPPCSPCSP